MQYSVIKYSSLEKTSKRFDPEYYHPHNLKLYKKLQSMPNLTIGDFSFVTDGIHESINFDENSKINLISAKAPKENYFDLSGCGHISELQDKKNSRTRLQVNDVIVSTVGTIGNCAVVDETILPANSDRHVGIIRVKKGVSPYFLSVFLLSNYGRFQTLRESTGNVQLNLFIYKIKEIIIPALSKNFQGFIENACLLASKLYKNANNSYSQAEQIILSELGLVDWKPKHQLSFIKNFSDTKTAERIDAEYFQPMYEEIIGKIKKYKNGFKPLGQTVTIKNQNFMPNDAITYKYIELSNISANGNISGVVESKGEELPTRARRKVNTGDVIVSSIEGSLSSIALISNELDNALCSTGFHVINSDEINSETLLIFLKSLAGQLQLKKGCSGTILTAINDGEFKRIILPKMTANIQKEIKKKISEMYETKALSKRLLDIAKCGVEMAIEKDEKQAQNWINSELKKLNITLKES